MIKQIVTNGCSWMFGMGCTSFETSSEAANRGRNTDRVSALFADKYNAKDINLSMPGASNDRILRTTTEWFLQNAHKRHHNETFVLIGLTEIVRSEVWFNPVIKNGDGDWYRAGLGNLYREKKFKIYNEYIDTRDVYFRTWRSCYERTLRNIVSLAAICEYYGARYLITDALANLRHWSLNGYINDLTPGGGGIVNPISFQVPKFREHDYLYDGYGNYNDKSEDEKKNGYVFYKNDTSGPDSHHNYKRSLDKIIRTNPNIYVDTTFDQICGGANYYQRKDKPYFEVPGGWKVCSEDMDKSLYAVGPFDLKEDGSVVETGPRETGHPGNEGNRVWYEHLQEYIRKHKIL